MTNASHQPAAADPMPVINLANLRNDIRRLALGYSKLREPLKLDRPLSTVTGGYALNGADLQTLAGQVVDGLRAHPNYRHAAQHIQVTGGTPLQALLSGTMLSLCGYLYREVRDHLKAANVETEW